jgi:lipoyl(octanoyl) transferase
MCINSKLIIKKFNIVDYKDSWSAMQEFNAKRDDGTIDEIWLLQHNPVYTLGLAGKESHVLQQSSIPIIRTDRGGQITYHGPGQLIIYLLINLKRKKLTVSQLIAALENTIIGFLDTLNCKAYANPNARGVYIDNKKIASIGLRVSKGCSYHGLSFNIDLDLKPFDNINPCGIKNLEMINLVNISKEFNIKNIVNIIIPYLTKQLQYDKIQNFKVDYI